MIRVLLQATGGRVQLHDVDASGMGIEYHPGPDFEGREDTGVHGTGVVLFTDRLQDNAFIDPRRALPGLHQYDSPNGVLDASGNFVEDCEVDAGRRGQVRGVELAGRIPNLYLGDPGRLLLAEGRLVPLKATSLWIQRMAVQAVATGSGCIQSGLSVHDHELGGIMDVVLGDPG